MVRTQIQLPESQVATLKHLAALHQTSMAELIRRAVDLFTSSPNSDAITERKQRALAVVGRFHSGLSDVAERHDEYLSETYR